MWSTRCLFCVCAENFTFGSFTQVELLHCIHEHGPQWTEATTTGSPATENQCLTSEGEHATQSRPRCSGFVITNPRTEKASEEEENQARWGSGPAEVACRPTPTPQHAIGRCAIYRPHAVQGFSLQTDSRSPSNSLFVARMETREYERSEESYS